VATATNEADEIRLKMARIRRELHEDVREVVASAEAVTDWRRYIRMYPWAALGVPFAVGYLIVPRKHRPVPIPIVVPAGAAEVREAIDREKEREKDKAKEPQRKGLVGMALGFLAPIALRAAQGYAVQYLEAWIAQQQQASATGPRPVSGQPDPSGFTGRPQARPPF
jgi:hypothetical protein